MQPRGIQFGGEYRSLTPSDKKTTLTRLSTAKKHQKIDEFLTKPEQQAKIAELHPEIKLHLEVKPGWFGRRPRVIIHNDKEAGHREHAKVVKKHFWNTLNCFFKNVIKQAEKIQKKGDEQASEA